MSTSERPHLEPLLRGKDGGWSRSGEQDNGYIVSGFGVTSSYIYCVFDPSVGGPRMVHRSNGSGMGRQQDLTDPHLENSHFAQL